MDVGEGDLPQYLTINGPGSGMPALNYCRDSQFDSREGLNLSKRRGTELKFS